MPAVAEILSTVASKPDPRGCDLPTCPVCADFHGGRGSFRLPQRSCDQLSLDLRHLRLRLRDQAFGEEVRLQLSLSSRRNVTARPFGARLFLERLESAAGDRLAHALHQVLVIGDVDFRQQHRAERFARPDQMMQIGARDSRAPPAIRFPHPAAADRRRGGRCAD